MKWYTAKTPKLVKRLFPSLIWEFSISEKIIYLTFDDGPIPEVTPWVLEQLGAYNAKATFFCIGDNIQKHPHIFEQILDKGHAIGNHTQHHLNAWKVSKETYVRDVLATHEIIKKSQNRKDKFLFRPPYGKITPKKATEIKKLGYQIVMWDVLSGDFDKSITPEKCLQNVLKHTTEGSIVVFHDSLKAEEKLKYALPKVLKHFSEQGYAFHKIDVSS